MNVAIIGGGVGGLMGALYLTQQGYDVTIYEKDSQLGGRLRFVEKDGYRIDEGPTIVLLPEMFQELLGEAGISKQRYELLLCDPLYTIRFPDGKVYTKYPDIQRQAEEVERTFPGEKEGFLRFMTEGRERFEIGKSAFLEHSFVKKSDFWTPGNVKNLLKLKPQQSVKKLMSNYFRDERLQLAYTLQALYIGGDPFNAPAMYSLVPFSEHEHGVHYLKGGYGSLIPLLESELRSRPNLKIHTDHPVENIVVEQDKVKGIETKEGFKGYDAVIYNGDFPSIGEVLPQAKKREFTPSSGCVLLYFGLDRVYENANVHQFFIGKSYSDHMKHVFSDKKLPDDPAFYTFHPSIIDDSLAPEGKGVMYVLIPVPAGTDIQWAEEKEWIDGVIDRMEELAFPDFTEAVEWMEVRTPTEAEAFGLFQGGSFGIGPTLFQSGVFRPQVKPFKTQGLYAVGASVHPGGGIPIVMQGAKLLAEQVQRDLTSEGSGS
ncbi:NAD(P)/FAD-dependent oxidoreductase [Planococcus sp. NCCP-2050]|uniref:phytoene desaturase family protein n=1 Tax=Planococcus sp. NCCP-2050 TaxID=2944679 RepID=UPI00203BE6D5|nr:phytoene desaturase family protein [Planococcus sp. NCCP-2050]GKW45734.1 dehydrosqualene desaturase [Planococcus sp. NCCP-2050]